MCIQKGSTYKIRVAEVGRLSANAKNAFNFFVRSVIANLRQKKCFFSAQHKMQFLRVFALYKTRKLQQILIWRQNSLYQSLKVLSGSKLFGERRSRNFCRTGASIKCLQLMATLRIAKSRVSRCQASLLSLIISQQS